LPVGDDGQGLERGLGQLRALTRGEEVLDDLVVVAAGEDAEAAGDVPDLEPALSVVLIAVVVGLERRDGLEDRVLVEAERPGEFFGADGRVGDHEHGLDAGEDLVVDHSCSSSSSLSVVESSSVADPSAPAASAPAASAPVAAGSASGSSSSALQAPSVRRSTPSSLISVRWMSRRPKGSGWSKSHSPTLNSSNRARKRATTTSVFSAVSISCAKSTSPVRSRERMCPRCSDTLTSGRWMWSTATVGGVWSRWSTVAKMPASSAGPMPSSRGGSTSWNSASRPTLRGARIDPAAIASAR